MFLTTWHVLHHQAPHLFLVGGGGWGHKSNSIVYSYPCIASRGIHAGSHRMHPIFLVSSKSDHSKSLNKTILSILTLMAYIANG